MINISSFEVFIYSRRCAVKGQSWLKRVSDLSTRNSMEKSHLRFCIEKTGVILGRSVGKVEEALREYRMAETLLTEEKIKKEDLKSDEGKREAGIFGLDPRVYASHELGEKIANRIADQIGQKAKELLKNL
jgi:hypothetical protein